MFGDPVVATVILNRFLHHSQVVTNRKTGEKRMWNGTTWQEVQ